ncbi:unnamed protein product [Phytophthora lilii]|uniref:Unnamed protein product n=1 Tax=Phytophthora lilii TaxID=2077276 RepID=A0A9W6TZ64_9STRA|nr:unnamed protein product [Phytophthora lilii]
MSVSLSILPNQQHHNGFDSPTREGTTENSPVSATVIAKPDKYAEEQANKKQISARMDMEHACCKAATRDFSDSKTPRSLSEREKAAKEALVGTIANKDDKASEWESFERKPSGNT